MYPYGCFKIILEETNPMNRASLGDPNLVPTKETSRLAVHLQIQDAIHVNTVTPVSKSSFWIPALIQEPTNYNKIGGCIF